MQLLTQLYISLVEELLRASTLGELNSKFLPFHLQQLHGARSAKDDFFFCRLALLFRFEFFRHRNGGHALNDLEVHTPLFRVVLDRLVMYAVKREQLLLEVFEDDSRVVGGEELSILLGYREVRAQLSGINNLFKLDSFFGGTHHNDAARFTTESSLRRDHAISANCVLAILLRFLLSEDLFVAVAELLLHLLGCGHLSLHPGVTDDVCH